MYLERRSETFRGMSYIGYPLINNYFVAVLHAWSIQFWEFSSLKVMG